MRIGLQKLDVAVAAAATAGICLETWLAPATVDHHQVVNLLLWLPVGIVVAVRRRHPLVAGLVAGTLAATAQNIYPSSLISGAVAWMCDLYAFTVWTGPRTFWAGLVAYVGGSSVAVALGPNVSGGATFVVVSAIVMALVRLVLVRDRERRARIVERERELAAREAVVEERARIARELHDAIAHNVSMMVVQAGAERRVLDDGHRSTREVLETVEQIGRGALTEMRRLVGMLRSDEDDPLAPQPGLDDLERLVVQVREAGLPVELSVEGDRRRLPVGLELSAYRIVQEALTNALKHAGDARARVCVRFRDDSLELEVVDDGAGAQARTVGGGHGLVGMRERVAMYGGRFEAGRRPAGGFTVRVLLPIR
ncbi:MAG TPA: sensor histidine kinase [Gaiellaceae bacterium]|nr:sensor histidine kinase [Gaiellaceae bacterium]